MIRLSDSFSNDLISFLMDLKAIIEQCSNFIYMFHKLFIFSFILVPLFLSGLNIFPLQNIPAFHSLCFSSSSQVLLYPPKKILFTEKVPLPFLFFPTKKTKYFPSPKTCHRFSFPSKTKHINIILYMKIKV